tara:strand:- start:752 stop:1489 length:738 start_codon:yes stop_codon:yes gene_type:complete
MARVIKLKESDITKIVKKILKERKFEMPDLSGLPPDHYPDFDNPFGDGTTWNTGGGGGGTTWGGNKGDKSKTHPGRRDYEGNGGVEITFETMKEALGDCRTMDDCLRGYEALYNRGKKGKIQGMPTPQEMSMKVMEIEESDPDPSPAMFIWLLVGTAVALGIRWINGTNPWTWNSDVTLKENINLVGKSKSGINIYEFDYINKKYGNGRYRGVMAQEVPSASFVGPEGTLMVDYSKLDVQFEELN